MPIFSEIKFVPSRRGRPMLLYGNYTYTKVWGTKNGTLWYCSSRSSKNCRAQAIISNDGTMKKIEDEHNHDPPKFHISSSGEYIRL